MTGLHVSEFDQVLDDLAPRYGQAEKKRLSRPNRQRAIGRWSQFRSSTQDDLGGYDDLP